LRLERTLNNLVNQDYGLTPAEMDVLNNKRTTPCHYPANAVAIPCQFAVSKAFWRGSYVNELSIG
jgi:hypothetical protein